MKIIMYIVGAFASLVVMLASAWIMNTIEKYCVTWWKERV
jgi:hypothetical protein